LARKILLADDSVTAQNMGRRILSDAGYEVTTVNNGSAALKRIADSKPDLIVLDVYMPGYGGLEVCQRLRESEETARIPVLLTVGKLEPFKVEDVRRVRADAFIIKPFEASELLAALTKLEDKIVPVAQPRKPGRMPKAGASVDEFMGTAREYGDTETGWKNRLRIPPPHRKSQPEFPEPEPEMPRQTQPALEAKREYGPPKPGSHDIRKEEPRASEAKTPVPETKLPSGFPAGITMEELAAIQAAAAAFTMPAETAAKPVAKVEAQDQKPAELAAEPAKEKAIAETEAAAIASADEKGKTDPASLNAAQVASAPAAAESSVAREISVGNADAVVEPAAPVEAAASAESTAAPVSEPSPANQEKLAEHEVAAVLASLEFVNGTNSRDADDEPFFATIAAAPVAAELSGPRWVATSVPVSEEESSLILEQEMQKALAAMAELNVTEVAPTSTDSTASENVESPVTSERPEIKPEEPAPMPVAASSDEQAASPQAVEAVASPAPEPVASQEEAAYAAAAASGSAMGETTVSAEAAAPAATPARSGETPSTESQATEAQGDSELASAWASWKQIRESVVSPQMTSEVADAAAAALSEEASSAETASAEPVSSEPATAESAPESNQPEASVTAEPEAANGEDSEAIANIVDSVLSELKPKLMKEIAKKMGKPKKRH
jgi:twitching motility two-component system response regulator PilH